MNAYSLDLREKIVTTYEGGNTSIRKVARRFQVSKGVVQNLINLKRRTGELRPKKATGGRKSQLAGREEEIALMVEEHPDYTLAEYCEYFGEKTGIRVSVSTMCRALDKQNLTRKKKLEEAIRVGEKKISANG